MCEMCGYPLGHGAYWHQFKPVERFICCDCAVSDQHASPNWHGKFIPRKVPALTPTSDEKKE